MVLTDQLMLHVSLSMVCIASQCCLYQRVHAHDTAFELQWLRSGRRLIGLDDGPSGAPSWWPPRRARQNFAPISSPIIETRASDTAPEKAKGKKKASGSHCFNIGAASLASRMISSNSKPTASDQPALVSSRPPPLIPLDIVDAPTQRLWAVSIAAAVQAYKIYTFFLPDASLSLALLLDLALVLSLARLRIPRLQYSDAAWAVIGFAVGAIDWIILGGWSALLTFFGMGSLTSWLSSTWDGFFSRPMGLSEHRVRINNLVRSSNHLLGQHTIHILPHSTATFSPAVSSCHCVGFDTPEVNIPIYFNNTEPHALQYSLTPFGANAVPELFNVSISKASLVSLDTDNELPYESFHDGGWDEVEAEIMGRSALARRQGHNALGRQESRIGRGKDVRLKMSKSRGAGQQKSFNLIIRASGRLRLERVLDRNGLDVRIARGEIMVVDCPSMFFSKAASHAQVEQEVLKTLQDEPHINDDEHLCPGDSAQLQIGVLGTAPLEVSYRRVLQLNRLSGRGKSLDETLKISHIADPHLLSPLVGTDIASTEAVLSALLDRRRASKPATEFKTFDWAVPQLRTAALFFSADVPGTYDYVLERVRDACGNEVSGDAILRAGRASATRKSLAVQHSASHRSNLSYQRLQVHSRAHAAIVGCSADKPLRLLRGGHSVDVVLKLSNVETDANFEWTALVRFQSQTNETIGDVPQGWTRNVTVGKDGTAHVKADAPGTYAIEKLDGTYCSGEIGSPWSCLVVEVPPPTAEITFAAIEDVCAGSVGVNALAVLSGQPPFRLQYEIQKAGRGPVRQERIIERTREEFEFRPSTEGAVRYRFVGLSDSNYRAISLDGPFYEQVVHPLASARFVQTGHQTPRQANQSIIMRSCEGNRAYAAVELEGKGPFDLTYAVRASDTKSVAPTREGRKVVAVEQYTVKAISGPHYDLNIELPPHINAHGGSLTVSLVSIKDAKNCERALTTSDINIEIRRVEPTAAFILPNDHQRKSPAGQGVTEILEGAEARLPVRLEGEGPWKVEYLREGEPMPVTATLRTAEAELIVDRPGTYRLLSVHDAFCNGKSLSAMSTWVVFTRNRPSVQFESEAGVRSANNGSLLRPAVCKGTPDSAGLRTTGHYPVQITYEHLSPAWLQDDIRQQQNQRSLMTDGSETGSGRRQRRTFSTAQENTALHLTTSTPGLHKYQLIEIGDAVYPLSALPPPSSISRSSQGMDNLQLVEQYVHPLPTAQFVETNGTGGRRAGVKKESYCLGDTLSSSRSKGNKGSFAPAVRLSGTPPFTLEFKLTSASDSQASSRRFVRSKIQTHTVALDVDGHDVSDNNGKPFRFDASGKWTFQILSLVDGNGCSSVGVSTTHNGGANPDLGGAGGAFADIEVAETASIAPIGTRTDYCVGENVEYVLQGTPPWTVHYAFNGKESSASNLRASFFSRVAEREGVLEIRSVAHQTNTCRRVIDAKRESGMRRIIHPLPRAKIMEGGSTVQDLREGAMATIFFRLEGTPPFSLTYQHLQPEDYYTHPRVLSEATVAGIMEHEYRISTHEEGTWRIVWLQDRFCQSSAPARMA